MIRFGHRSDSMKNAEIGLPVSERKRIDEARCIERDELVQHVFRQPALSRIAAEVTVPEVTSTRNVLVREVSQSGERPQSVRRRLRRAARPADLRARCRVGSTVSLSNPVLPVSLPRRRRRFSQSEASGVATDMARR